MAKQKELEKLNVTFSGSWSHIGPVSLRYGESIRIRGLRNEMDSLSAEVVVEFGPKGTILVSAQPVEGRNAAHN